MTTQFTAALDDFHARIAETDRMPPQPAERQFLAIGPESGRLINLIVRALDKPQVLEIGTSLGYSTLWLAEAARAAGGHVTTLEQNPAKSEEAHRALSAAGLADTVTFLTGDALDLIPQLDAPIDFVLMDLWKDLYLPCFDAVRPKLAAGAMLVADNMIRGGTGEGTAAYARAVRSAPGFSSVLLPVGSGLEVSRLDD